MHVLGLLSVPPQLVSHTFRNSEGTKSASRVLMVPQTRLGLTLSPPDLQPPDWS